MAYIWVYELSHLLRDSSSHSFLSFDHGFDTVIHILNESGLRATESASVRDVVDVVVGFGVLTVSTTNLDEVLVSDSLEGLLVLSKIGEVDMDRSTKSGSEVGWARSDVTEVVVVSELSDLFDSSSGVTESLEDSKDVCTRLHRDNAELVLFIDPSEEGLLSVVEDAATLRPITVQVACLEEAVALFEKEVVVNQLLAVSLRELSEFVVFASKLALEGSESLLSSSLDGVTLVT